jgi:hypothetical protein
VTDPPSKPNPRLDDGSMSATMFLSLAPPRMVLRPTPIAQGSRNSSGCFPIAGFSVVARESKLRQGCLAKLGSIAPSKATSKASNAYQERRSLFFHPFGETRKNRNLRQNEN